MDQKPEGELIEVVMSPSKEELEEDAEVLRLKTLLYTPEEEKKVVRKFDLHILTFLCALYMLSYLDRGNIGNAKTAGMNKDLGMTDSQFQWLLTIFYISYIVFQWLTMLWKIFRPRFYVPCVVIAWGVISSCFAAANNWGGLMAMRFLLGVLEAGFGPGVPYYLTFFYYRHEVAWRTGIFMAVSPLSSAFAGALAYGITKNELAIENWRVLFLVEGLPTIAVGIIGFYAIQNEGRTCRFLTPVNRILLLLAPLSKQVPQNVKTSLSSRRLSVHLQISKTGAACSCSFQSMSRLQVCPFTCLPLLKKWAIRPSMPKVSRHHHILSPPSLYSSLRGSLINTRFGRFLSAELQLLAPLVTFFLPLLTLSEFGTLPASLLLLVFSPLYPCSSLGVVIVIAVMAKRVWALCFFRL